MNDRHLTDDALDDQLRRFYQDVYEPMEPASHMWKKLASQLDVASPLRKGVLTTPQPPARGSTMPQIPPYTGRMRHRLGSAVAVLLTGIIIIASLALFHMFPAQSVIIPSVIIPSVTHIETPQAYSTAGVPVTPVATPGPQHTYVTNVVTAQGVSTDFAPVHETSHFTAGQEVYVVCLVRGITKGQPHTISIHWFYDGTDMELPMINGKTSDEITSNQVVYFSMTYETAGLGMAKIFFDLPSTDNGDRANDPYLAAQITFAIDPAPVGRGTATPAGTASTSPTTLLGRSVTTMAVALRPNAAA
jgi:hypothetical protein